MSKNYYKRVILKSKLKEMKSNGRGINTLIVGMFQGIFKNIGTKWTLILKYMN